MVKKNKVGRPKGKKATVKVDLCEEIETEISAKNRSKYFQRLTSLMKDNKGKITPQDVVDDARDVNAPYHNYFDWDDSVAGPKFRLAQARHLLMSTIKTIDVQGEPMKQKAFFNVKNAKGQNFYVNVESAVKKSTYRLQLIEQLLQTMERTQNLLKMFQDYEQNGK